MADIKMKKCPRCGGQFPCHSENDCWCESVQVPSKVAKYLTMQYTDCICKACLLQLIKENSA